MLDFINFELNGNTKFHRGGDWVLIIRLYVINISNPALLSTTHWTLIIAEHGNYKKRTFNPYLGWAFKRKRGLRGGGGSRILLDDSAQKVSICLGIGTSPEISFSSTPETPNPLFLWLLSTSFIEYCE